ncbi:MAG: sensor histidine kinase [Verrucomicrobiae bacterium]|nr:sensor histidine kinase [Verrucomicrobiae bacterium]MCB1087678.1 sensor histidine kinase [Verrucomicrobiae bacterium]
MKATVSADPIPVEDRRSNEAIHHLTVFMRGKPAWLPFIPLFALTILVGWLDFYTGWELSLFIFYAVPISLAVWWIGSKAGTILAVFCGIIWWLANEQSHPYETQLGYTWAMVSRLFYFFVAGVAVAAVRRKQDADAARIRMLEDHHQLEQDIVGVSDYEQQRIGQDLHDGLCQMLAAIGCATRILADDLRSKGVSEAEDATLIEESLQRTVLEARNLARGIFPVHVDRDGLTTAISDLVKMTSKLTGVIIEFNEPDVISINDPKTAMNLYRIAQEAVANAVRHGEATRINIDLFQRDNLLYLQIEDNGKGFPENFSSNQKGMGLRVMRYRAQCVNGTLGIGPGRNGGVKVSCTMPLNQTNEQQEDGQ